MFCFVFVSLSSGWALTCCILKWLGALRATNVEMCLNSTVWRDYWSYHVDSLSSLWKLLLIDATESNDSGRDYDSTTMANPLHSTYDFFFYLFIHFLIIIIILSLLFDLTFNLFFFEFVSLKFLYSHRVFCFFAKFC